jgi:hypothetical protein
MRFRDKFVKLDDPAGGVNDPVLLRNFAVVARKGVRT